MAIFLLWYNDALVGVFPSREAAASAALGDCEDFTIQQAPYCTFAGLPARGVCIPSNQVGDYGPFTHPRPQEKPE